MFKAAFDVAINIYFQMMFRIFEGEVDGSHEAAAAPLTRSLSCNKQRYSSIILNCIG